MVTVAPELTGYAAVDGTQVFYRERGSGATAVLIHGTGADADCWGPVFDELAQGLRVIAFDRRSYTRSVAAPLNSVARHTADLAAILDHLGGGPAMLIGWSFGGPMSLRLASSRPELVSALVLVEPALPWLRCVDAGILAALFAARARQLTGRPTAAVEEFERWASGYRDRAGSGFDNQATASRQAQVDNTPSALMELGMMPWQAVSPAAVRSVRCPTTLVVGEQSPSWYRKVARAIERLLPETKVVTAPGSGHFVHVDAPEVFVETVRRAATGAVA